MKISRITNGISCESEMSKALEEYLQAYNLHELDMAGKHQQWDPVYLTIRREVRVKEVGRVADFLIKRKGKLINIEAKCVDFPVMFQQLEDHSQYCDYSFAYILSTMMTPVWFKRRLIQMGYGLIIYDPKQKVCVEALEASMNAVINPVLKEKMLKEVSVLKLKRTK